MEAPSHFSYLISEQVHTVLSCMMALLALGLALRARAHRAEPDWRWIGMIGLMLIVGRWPSIWYGHQLNPDESLFLSGANTLRFDPVFWHSVNGMTSGPLNYYALLPVGTLLGGDSYFSAHVTALLLIAIAVSCVHLAVSRRYGARVARMSGLPTLCWLSMSAHVDFTHYSSELLSMALIAIALYLATRIVFDGVTSPGRELAIGFLLGWIPYAKPQAIPIAFTLGAGLTAWLLFAKTDPESTKTARVARLVGSASAGSLFFGVLIAVNHLGPYVWLVYWLNNRAYVASATLSIFRTGFRLIAKTDPRSPIFFFWVFSGMAFFALALPWLKARSRRDWIFFGSAAILLAVTALAVVTPRRTFPHYLMLLPVPWLLLSGGFVGLLVGRAREKPLVATATFAAFSGMVLVLTAIRAAMPYPLEETFSPYSSDFSGRVITEITKYAGPNDALAVWGWRCEYNVLTHLRQGARDAITETLISPNPYQEQFRKLYLEDLELSRPAVFVDGVGPGGFYFADRAKDGHDVLFPALADWVRKNYIQVADLEGSRIYARADRYSNVMTHQMEPVTDVTPGTIRTDGHD